MSDEDLEAEDWGINTKSPSPQPLGDAAPPLTQSMEGEGGGEDAMNALAAAKQLLSTEDGGKCGHGSGN